MLLHGKYSKKGKKLRLFKVDLFNGNVTKYCETEEQAKALVKFAKEKSGIDFDYKITYLG